jgi:UDP-N-acetylglucosamine/UDP-N-acetylgalactosamine 4-epimerase
MERRLDPGVVINIGTGARVGIRDLFDILARHAGFPGAPVLAPARAGDVPHSVASIDRARGQLGFEPRWRLDQGLERTIAWYRAGA